MVNNGLIIFLVTAHCQKKLYLMLYCRCNNSAKILYLKNTVRAFVLRKKIIIKICFRFLPSSSEESTLQRHLSPEIKLHHCAPPLHFAKSFQDIHWLLSLCSLKNVHYAFLRILFCWFCFCRVLPTFKSHFKVRMSGSGLQNFFGKEFLHTMCVTMLPPAQTMWSIKPGGF